MTKALQLLVRYLSFGVLLVMLFLTSTIVLFGVEAVGLMTFERSDLAQNLGSPVRSFFENLSADSHNRVFATSGFFALWTTLSLTWTPLRGVTFPWLYGCGLACLVLALVEALIIRDFHYMSDGFDILVTFVNALVIIGLTLVIGLALLIGAVIVDFTRHGNSFTLHRS